MTEPARSLRRQKYGRVVRDVLLLPPALLYVIIEQVFWNGAKTLLRQTARIAFIETARLKLKRLSPLAVLPLFLVPEFFSHAGGVWASYLLLRREFLAAILIGIFIKGSATMMAV